MSIIIEEIDIFERIIAIHDCILSLQHEIQEEIDSGKYPIYILNVLNCWVEQLSALTELIVPEGDDLPRH